VAASPTSAAATSASIGDRAKKLRQSLTLAVRPTAGSPHCLHLKGRIAGIGDHAKQLRHSLTPAVRPAAGSPSTSFKR